MSDKIITNGQWKPTAEGVYSGYHVSQFMCTWITAEKICEAFNDPMKDKQYFWNYVLGLPYLGSDDKIDPATVLKNCVSSVNEQESPVVIGVDTGLPIHFVIMNKQGVFYYGTCEPETEYERTNPNYDPYDKLEVFLTRWDRATIVSDQGGDLIGIRKLQAKYPGRVFLCFYRKDRKSNDAIKWGENDEYGTVIVDRNKEIQIIVEQLRDLGRIRLNGTKEEWQEFASHFGNIYREKIVVKENKDKDDRTLYGNEYVWKRNGADHYVHSLLYAIVGMSKYGAGLAKIIGDDPYIGMRGGQIIQDKGVSLGYSPEQMAAQRVEL